MLPVAAQALTPAAASSRADLAAVLASKEPRCLVVAEGASQVDVKEAARAAKAYIIDLFEDEQIEHVGLEEVRFDDLSEAWDITIGFSRPWNRSALGTIIASPAHRSYKTVRINDKDGEVLSVAHRALTPAD